MLRTFCLAAALSLTSLPRLASAQESDGPTPAQIRAAAEAFDLGREAYQRQDFVNAAAQFERADSQAPSSTALEYAIRARVKAGHLDRAATLAALGAERHPEDVNLAKLVPELLERAGRELFELSVSCAEPCELAVSDKIVHGAPSLSRVVFLSAGEHVVRAGFGFERGASRDVTALAGGKGTASFEPPPAEAEPIAPPPPESPPVEEPLPESRGESRGWSPAVFWVGAALSATAGAATIWSGIDTLNNPGEKRVQEECPPGDESCPLYQDGLRSQIRTNILIGVTAGLGVGTLLVGLLATDWNSTENAADAALSKRRAKSRATPFEIEPWLAVGEGTLLGARGRF